MPAEILDIGILVLIVLSAVIGLIRGFVREALSLATWIAAVGLSFLYVKPLAAELPFAVQSEVARMGIAFAIIFFGVLVVGAIINHLLSTAVSSIGLGKVDHVLGGVFGVLRGGLIVTLLVMLLGLTVSKQSWWQSSLLAPWFVGIGETIKAVVPIPQSFSNYLEHPTAVIPPSEVVPQ
ncbi:MAG: CvpA family protein [Thiothrix sp.]|uniref:CvpA family protein n=1 Tax=Thiothrix sp. TaxID=1032 RepID=UPI0026377FA7|nr:CvpA family protein [Thiothrix sp.]MDD5394704.1 CvpA family protein [Thiothrix sp.]